MPSAARLTAATIIAALTVLGGPAVRASTPAGATPADAYTEPLPLTHVRGRHRVSLDGKWRYIVDPMRMGFRPGRMRNFSRDLRAEDGELLEYDWAAAPMMDVPGDWNSQVDELRWYDGLLWLQRRFDAEMPDGQRTFLHFEAVNYHAHVYLNGQKLAEHRGGFTPFSVEITGRLRPKDNSLVVGVDSLHTSTSVPSQVVDWWNYGGITRSVHLVHVPQTFVRHFGIALGRDGSLSARVELDGAARAGTEVAIAVPDAALTLRGRTDGSGVAQLKAQPKRLRRWSPKDPFLHSVTVRAAGDAISDRIGFRTVEVRGRQIFLNGEPLFLRGISLHEEAIGPVANRNITEAGARALLGEAQALNANFVRLSHYPHSEITTRLADELGLLVWAEIPVYWSIAFEEAETLSLARRMLAEMIERDRNRASVIIWSVGNETPETEARLRFMRTLIDDVRSRDATRLVTAAMHDDADSSSGPDGRVRVDDPLGAFIDVLAMNRYEAWYGYRNPTQIDEVNWDVAYDKPLIFSEFGADALFGFRADALERWSEDYQRLLYERTFSMADRIPNLAGLSPWILKDFRSPRRFHGRFQEYWNRKGLIDPSGRRKLAFETVREYYLRRAEGASR
jgi:beta-glucuronidase